MIFSFVHLNILFTTICLGFLFFVYVRNASLFNYKDIGEENRGRGAYLSNVLLKQKSRELLTDLKLVHSWVSRQQKEREEASQYLNKRSKDLAVEILPEFPLTFHHRDVFMCGRSTTKLLILIFSDINEYEERQIIRDTWAKLEMRAKHTYELRWKRVFVVGYPLEKAGSDEAFVREVMHNDLLGVHSENTRTMQTLYGALYWALNGCSFENLLIVKSKMFINIPAVYKLLHSSSANGKLYINTVTMETKDSKTKAAKKNPLKIFSAYKETGAWLASRNILPKLLPEIRIFMNSKFEGTENIVNEFMQQIHVIPTLVENFLTKNGSCHYQQDYFLSLEKTINCFPTMQHEYENSIKQKSII